MRHHPFLAVIFLFVLSGPLSVWAQNEIPAQSTRNDPYRPLFHYTPPSGWINDPNGLVYFKGVWHLGIQAGWPRTWGHATSTDLIHWKEQPTMLYPDELGDMWSGSAAVDRFDTTGFFSGKPGLVAAFTAWGPSDIEPKKQRVGLAFSRDDGNTWEKFSGNPVLEDKSLLDFRDPKIFWHEPTHRWIAVVTVGNAMRIYSAPDLKNWRRESTFAENMLEETVAWECPDLFPITTGGSRPVTKWVLLASYVSQKIFSKPPVFGACREVYFIGDFDGKTFHPDPGSEQPLKCAYGDTYATVTWNDVPASDGRRVAIGWMNHWGYAKLVPTESWQGALTLPRILTLKKEKDGGFRLRQNPTKELTALRGKGTELKRIKLKSGTHSLKGLAADTGELIATFDIGAASEVGLKVRQGTGNETLIGYDAISNEIFIDRSRSGIVDFHEHFKDRLTAPLETSHGRLKLQVILDKSSVEVFAEDGAVYLAAVIFPDEEDRNIAAYSKGSGASLNSIQLFPQT
ncbi:MAG: glycoside hydrolase family 32 protein [Verrucomicrobiae bacterium]|nr:glycoside hydrolase family 32 protein [Verrucomicrobiae bacterium]